MFLDFYQRWARVRLDGAGGVILEIFTVGVKAILRWGGKKNFYHFFPFYKILANFSAIFII